MSTLQKTKKTSAQGSTTPLAPGVADVELPTDVQASKHPHGAARSPAVALAAREAQHGARLHEAVATQTDAGQVQGPPQGDHCEVPVEVDRLAEGKAVIQEERDASGEFFVVKTDKREPVTSSVGA